MATMRLANRRARAESAIGSSFCLVQFDARAGYASGRRATVVLRTEHPAMGAQQFDLHLARHLPFAGVEHRLHLPGVARHGGDSDERATVPVRVAGLGDRHLEPPQPGHDRPDHRSLVLQRVDLAQQDVELQDADVASAVARPVARSRRPARNRRVRPGRPARRDRTSHRAAPGLGARLFPHLVGLDGVLDLDVVPGAKADTAFEALADLGGIVLEPLERVDRAGCR